MRDIHWVDWILLPVARLEAFGVKHAPEERFQRVGHRKPLPLHWFSTIGLWGHTPRKRIHDQVRATEASLTGAAFNRFRRHWEVQTREQKTMDDTAGAADLALDIYTVSQHLAQRSPGISAGRLYTEAGRLCGVLPVEVLLHIHMTDLVLSHSKLSFEGWAQVTSQDRTELWNAFQNARPEQDIFGEVGRYVNGTKRKVSAA